MARTTWNKTFRWEREYPVLAVQQDKISYLTIERMLLLYQLKELLTGEKERRKQWEHRKAVWHARRARAGAWKEEWTYG